MAIAAVGLLAACGSETDDVGTGQEGGPPGAGGVTDLAEVIADRVPQVSASSDVVVAYSGADSTLGHTDTRAAVSTDGGRTFRRLPIDEPLYNPVVIVGGGGEGDDGPALLVGSPCEVPDGPDLSCDPATERVVGRLLDLGTGELRELLDPPLTTAFVSDGAGRTPAGAFVTVERNEGPGLLGWDPAAQEWIVSDLPPGTERVCAVGDGLVAVTAGAPMDLPPAGAPVETEPGAPPPTVPSAPIEEVAPGDVLFSAQESRDGREWTEAVPFTSDIERDLAFTVGVSCGPSAVLAFTSQAAVIAPGETAWRRVELPEGASIAPGVASAWASADEVRAWTVPSVVPSEVEEGEEGESPPGTHGLLTISGVDGREPTAALDAEAMTSTATPRELRGPGAAAHGLWLVVGDTVTLERVAS